MTTSYIDPRSFHVYKFDNQGLLFDRATESLAQLDNNLFDFLKNIEDGQTYDEAYANSTCLKDGIELEDIIDLLSDLSENGMLKYEEVDHVAQEKMIDSLMAHKPRRLQLLLAQGCNLGCRYCYAWRNGSNQKNTLMSFETAKMSVDHLIDRSGPRQSLQITFFGGEPLLNYEVLKEVVEYCKEVETRTSKKFVFEVITNATLLTKEVTHFLAEHRFLVMISLDGWKEMHNYNRPSMDGKDRYDEILENAIYLNEFFKRNKLPTVKVRANLTGRHHDISKVTEFFYEQGFDKIGIAAIEPLPHGSPSGSALTEEQMDTLAELEDIKARNLLAKIDGGENLSRAEKRMAGGYLEAPEKRALKGVTCGVVRNTAIVDNKGKIYPCHRYEGMENYIVGDISTGIDDTKARAFYQKLNKNATSRCHSCWIRDYCAGGCAWLLSDQDGTLVNPTDNECNRRRKSMERWLYARAKLKERLPVDHENGITKPVSREFPGAE